MAELFRALNDGAGAEAVAEERRAMYRSGGFPQSGDEFAAFAAGEQDALHAGERTYNQAFRSLYGKDSVWGGAARWQRASWEELEAQQRENERARHRVVGLVIETRPDAVTPAALTTIRRLGCTKVQMGVQSLDQEVLNANGRGMDVARIQEAFELLRVFGFKIHAHAMANLFGSTPERDKRDYERLVRERPFQPDEIKLYPCALIEGAQLCACYERGTWRPYSEDELLDVLVSDVAVTPAWTRISRMIRDFSSHDIVAGNKKPNLRQLVEMRLREQGETKGIQEIRFREVGTACVDMSALELDVVAYETSNTSERFLQWVTPDNRIAGFLRLSLPSASYVRALGDAMGRGRVESGAEEKRAECEPGEACEKLEMHVDSLPIREGEAMIREVHVYGMATQLGADGTSAQHLGLGRRLVERACAIAREAGYGHVNVISAVGTREYYRHLGFCDHGLYQRKELL